MRVLLTRPQHDSQALAELLSMRGIDNVIQPMLEIVARADATLDLAGIQAVLVTSANGARALAEATADRSLPVFAVGDATARAARAAGFVRIESAGGDVDDLAALVIAHLDPKAGPLCHVAGSAVAGDLAGRLDEAGFETRRAVLYEARPCRAFAPEAAAALRDGALDAVLLFSPRTAASFVRLAQEGGLAQASKRLAALCLSPAVAAAASGLPWRDVRIAREPTQDALLALLGTSGN